MFLVCSQPNVMTSAQRRKMKGYGDFKRIAVVIVPDDEKYKERCESQATDGKSVFVFSDNVINDMKGKCLTFKFDQKKMIYFAFIHLSLSVLVF